ncbi:MAG: sulfatase-like hydrolase/transferase [Candidatus Synoicihabitans palmerolidicus]|nr:sulfatase-like hydrolase/transferase [Candidatus Synoicihabitans palmerolidicus]
MIYIQLESMDGLMVGGRWNGEPVMPFLEGLAERNVYFTNAMDNTASGRTTDGEFLVLTSAVPVPRPPVYVRQHLDRIPSMPRVLKEAGYETKSLHGFNGVFWLSEGSPYGVGVRRDAVRGRHGLERGDRLGLVGSGGLGGGGASDHGGEGPDFSPCHYSDEPPSLHLFGQA